ncbi:putative fungal zn(2)-cys(6) binuclear cluster domain protein [Rhizoctonia solani 123E]|uniref:Putative fungal zn(2)-cys(6) binuclear cluster domain protein n=1 Tax=Rhizoctonia solani 123E TaxID=1423351 RepID=A0A074RLB5_9AGAM|nr:putative fungal zn(2)-cys(6) binuclear cluster domain protein [Rhizoctonia solani 123E]
MVRPILRLELRLYALVRRRYRPMNIQPEDPFIRDKRTPKIPAKIVLALLGAFLPVSNLPGHIPYPSGLASALGQAPSRAKSSSNVPVISPSAASNQDPLFDPPTNTHGQTSYQPLESVPASYVIRTAIPHDTSLFVSNPEPLSFGLSPASSSNTTYYTPPTSHPPGQSLSPSDVQATLVPSNPSRPNLRLHWPTLDENSDSDDPEALADVLAITGNPESESVVNCYSLWMIRFLFEPLRGIPTTRDIVIQGFARGGEALWIMMLLSNIAWQVLGTNPSNIDNPPYCSTLYSHILQRLAAARCHFETSRELDRCYAQSNKRSRCLVCIMCKVGTLSDVINVMQHAAVFRRAFPGSPESFVNLPSLLTTIDISFQSYATHDILLSMLTHRPMFFRYDVNYPPHLSDTSFSTDDGPGLRWLYGVPDWLMVILARMNALLEGYGGCLDPTVAKELEEEIRSKWTIVAAGVDPSPSMGRIVVQESRRLTAVFFYLWFLKFMPRSKQAGSQTRS